MKLTINEKSVEASSPSNTPLLWVLRDELGFTGTKYGCGMGQCGACTIHLNGEPARACITTLADAAGKAITTIEGLSSGAQLHPVQQAWLEADVLQCGYCQSGQMMAAAALLRKNAHPANADIDAAMTGHLCRCGTYERIRAGVHRAAELATSGQAKGAR
jgi:isoquinoline 1-oxidoreductase subunit alpha